MLVLNRCKGRKSVLEVGKKNPVKHRNPVANGSESAEPVQTSVRVESNLNSVIFYVVYGGWRLIH